jgi:F420-0:gamma-glutamyl ligase-like protein
MGIRRGKNPDDDTVFGGILAHRRTAIRFLRITPLRENGWNKDVIVASFSSQPQG